MAAGVFAVPADAGAVAGGRDRVGHAGAVLAVAHARSVGALGRCAGSWSGPRSEVFDAAASGALALTSRARGACEHAEALIGDLAAAVRRTTEELAHLQAEHDTLPPRLLLPGIDLPGVVGDAQRRDDALVHRAAELAHELVRVEQRVAWELDALTDALAPDLAGLPADQIARRVHAPPGGDSVLGALRTLTPALLADHGGTLRLAPDPSAPPREVACWWRSLGRDQRQSLLRADPRHYGNLDGVPALDRDLANRIVLSHEIEHVRSELASGEPDQTVRSYVGYGTGYVQSSNPAWTAWAELRTRLTTLTDLTALLAGSPALLLLGLQPRVGQGRAIISRGDPDTAVDTSILVPGTHANLDSMLDGPDRSAAMASSAARAGAPEDTSAHITWYGYDAPQDIVPQAARLTYADDAAPLLDRFASGLRATHASGERSHSTIVAHSYGTTVVGRAASRGRRLDVDDVVFVASPGIGVGNGWVIDDGTTVDDLHLSASSRGHVYATRSRDDLIRLAVGTRLGVDPTQAAFGAHVFAADPDDDHHAYWSPDDDPALLAMGMIVAGRGSEVEVAEPPRDDRPTPTGPTAVSPP